jgi:hypothetical protein
MSAPREVRQADLVKICSIIYPEDFTPFTCIIGERSKLFHIFVITVSVLSLSLLCIAQTHNAQHVGDMKCVYVGEKGAVSNSIMRMRIAILPPRPRTTCTNLGEPIMYCGVCLRDAGKFEYMSIIKMIGT